MASTEVARATVTIIPTMEGAQQTITNELAGIASSSGVTDAGRSAGSNFASGLGKGLSVVAGATAAVTAAAVKAADSFTDAASEVAAYGDNIDKMSQRLGLSYEGFQKWDYILGQSGTDINSMQTGLKTLTNQLDDARNGSADAQARFEALGLTLEDLNSMSREEVFESVIAGFQRMEDSTERAALANDLFGKSGQNLTPLFNTSIEETQALADAAEELGFIMSDDAVKASADYQDALDTMQRSMSGLKNNMMSEFLPGITGVMDGLADVFAGSSDSGIAKITEGIDLVVDQMTANFPKIVEIGMSIVESLGQAIMDNLPALGEAALQLLGTISGFILENLPTLIDVSLNLLLTLASGIIDNLPVIIPAVVDIVLQIVEKLTDPDTVTKLIEASLKMIIALAEGLIKALPVLLEKAPVIIENLLRSLIEAIPMLLDAADSVLRTLGEGIMSGLETVAEWGSQILQTIKDGIMKKVEDAKTWGKDLIENFVQGIKNSINLVGDAVSSVADKIKSFIGFSEPDEGPLSDFHTYAPDMIELFTEGLNESKAKISSTLTSVLQLPDSGMQMEAAGVGEAITIPVYIGQEKLDTIIVNANSRMNLVSGGR